MDELIAGYRKFYADHFATKDSLYHDLVRNGQRPKVLVIACSDSRVDPALLMGCSPGDMFVVRNVANLVPPFEGDHKHHGTSAAVEFAVRVLGVSNIIILGHTLCGGIQALVQGLEWESDFVADWMEIARPARQADTTECGRGSLLLSLKNLMTFPWVRERVERGKLSLHAWQFDLESGVIMRHEEERGWKPLFL
ncbi:MAG: carbonic anhydrase [Parachlamydiales bacterium]